MNIRRGIVAPPVLIDINGVDRAARHRGGCARAQDRRRGNARRNRRASAGDANIIRSWRRRPAISPARPSAIWARSAAIFASTRAAFSTIRANGGATPTIIASKPRARFATSRRKAAASASLLSGRSRAGAARARCRDRYRRAGGQAHDAARRSLYRLCAAGRAGDGNARRRQIFPVAAPGRIHRRRARGKYARPALGLRQDPHPPLDRISGHRRRRGVAARRRQARRSARRLHRHQSAAGAACRDQRTMRRRARCAACSPASTRWCAIRSWR